MSLNLILFSVFCEVPFCKFLCKFKLYNFYLQKFNFIAFIVLFFILFWGIFDLSLSVFQSQELNAFRFFIFIFDCIYSFIRSSIFSKIRNKYLRKNCLAFLFPLFFHPVVYFMSKWRDWQANKIKFTILLFSFDINFFWSCRKEKYFVST